MSDPADGAYHHPSPARTPARSPARPQAWRISSSFGAPSCNAAQAKADDGRRQNLERRVSRPFLPFRCTHVAGYVALFRPARRRSGAGETNRPPRASFRLNWNR
jgi:hypothetical protein